MHYNQDFHSYDNQPETHDVNSSLQQALNELEMISEKTHILITELSVRLKPIRRDIPVGIDKEDSNTLKEITSLVVEAIKLRTRSIQAIQQKIQEINSTLDI